MTTLNVRGHMTSWTGLGHVCERFTVGLARAGVSVRFKRTFRDDWYAPDPPALAALQADLDPDSPTLFMGLPIDRSPPPGCAFQTMWEADGLPDAAIAKLNTARVVIVPTAWNALMFQRAGVTVPIEIVPLGIDPETFHDDGSPVPTDPIVFGTAGRTGHGRERKGLDDVIRGFRLAFPEPAGVRLSVRCWEDCVIPADCLTVPGVEIVRGKPGRVDSLEGLAAWSRSLSCYVSASRGEGWGLHTHQAMACGRAAAVIPWAGVTEFWSALCGWPIAYELRSCPWPPYTGHNWAVSSPEIVASVLRRIVAEKESLAECGRAAARKAAEFSWGRAISRMIEVLQRHGVID